MKIVLNKGQKLWFTSDTHYNHSNICSATTKWKDPTTIREFKSLEHMNATIVGNINEYVAQDDILIHLGDWSFGGFESVQKLRDQIVCKNIHIITGNHDHHIENNNKNCKTIFSSVSKYMELNVKWNVGTPLMGEQNFILMHFPIASWNNMSKGAIHLHGHVHFETNKRIGPGKMMDVGVDGNDLYPVSLNKVLSIMNKQPIKSMFKFDHHEVVENYIK